MSLPKRKSRPLTVDGVDYRWSFSDTFCGESGTHKLFVTVQAASGRGTKLLATGYCATWPNLLLPRLIVTPKLVANMIHEALRNGWTTDSKRDYHIVELQRFENPEL